MNILEEAKKIKLKPFDGTTLGETVKNVIDSNLIDKVGFTDPGNINTMLDYFNMDKGDILENIDILKFIYKESQRYDYPLFDFLSEVGLRIGGKFSENILSKMHSYLSLLSQEHNLEKNIMNVKGELRLLENVENSDTI